MKSYLVVFILLSYFCAFHARPSFIENDSIVFPDSDNETLPSQITEKLKECIKDNFKIEFNGECRTLLTTESVCPEGQWLVLDLLSASLPKPIIKGKCGPKRCPSKQHFWLDQNRCVYPNESVSLCPKGNIISTDVFGDGFCECIREPIHTKDKNGVCYPVFTRGPCLNEKVYVQVNGHGECRADNCTLTRTRFPNKTIVVWSDNKCYAVNERGPCVQGYVVRINAWSVLPECGDPLTPLNLVNPPLCSGTDHANKCTLPVFSPQNQFAAMISNHVKNKRNKKTYDSPK